MRHVRLRVLCAFEFVRVCVCVCACMRAKYQARVCRVKVIERSNQPRAYTRTFVVCEHSKFTRFALYVGLSRGMGRDEAHGPQEEPRH